MIRVQILILLRDLGQVIQLSHLSSSCGNSESIYLTGLLGWLKGSLVFLTYCHRQTARSNSDMPPTCQKTLHVPPSDTRKCWTTSKSRIHLTFCFPSPLLTSVEFPPSFKIQLIFYPLLGRFPRTPTSDLSFSLCHIPIAQGCDSYIYIYPA